MGLGTWYRILETKTKGAMPVEIQPSSPEWAEIDAHMYMLNVLVNPQLFFDGERGMEEMPEVERQALIQIILGQIQEVIDES